VPRRAVREKSPARRVAEQRSGEAIAPSSRLTLLLDTNVVLDVILARSPWDAEAVLLLDTIARGRASGWIASHALTTVYYIVEREKGRSAAVTAVGDLLQLVGVVPLDTADFQRALAMGLGDYEDAVQAAACLRIGADFLVTRNARDFKGAPVEPRSAGEVIAFLAGSESE